MLLIPAAFLLLLEGGLRVFGYGYPTGFFVPGPARDQVQTNQRFGWRFFPKTIARAPDVCVLSVPKREDTTRVFIFGGSAAMGVPEPAYGVGRFLEAMLRIRYPERRFEVVNAAMTAINSHAVLPVARDCARLQPDVCIVYMGNNEVVGPYGCGTVFTGCIRSRSMIRLGLKLKTTRIGQWLSSFGEREVYAEWQGMEMFLAHGVSQGNPRLSTVYDHFRANLRETCETLCAAGSRVVVCTVASNLSDSPPFASEPGADGADAHYRLGRDAEKRGDPAAARNAFRRARDLDALRFRADSEINAIVRATAESMAGVALVDVADRFAALRDEEMFYEHVHFTPEGNYEIARLLFDELAAMWAKGDAVDAPSFPACGEWLALTEWNRYRMAADIVDMMGRAPFTNQMDHDSRHAARESRLRALRQQAVSPAALADAHRTHAAALELRPDDYRVRAGLARLLSRQGNHAAALEQWRLLMERFPAAVNWQSELGVACRAAGRREEAVREFRDIMRKYASQRPRMLRNIGVVRMEQGQAESAATAFRRALEMNPQLVRARSGLGAALIQLGRPDEAVAELSRALEADPRAESARYNLGVVLQMRGDHSGALAQYREALRLNPDSLDVLKQVAALLSRAGRTAEALPYHKAVAERVGDDAGAWFNVGAVLQRLGRTGEALQAYDRCLKLDARHLRAGHNRGDALVRVGRAAEAVAQYRRVLAHHPDCGATRHNLARMLASHPDEALRNGPEAVRLMQGIMQAPMYRNLPQFHFTMACAYAETGRFNEAVKACRVALDLAAKQGANSRIRELRDGLALFQQKKPHRIAGQRGTAHGEMPD